MNTEKYKKNIWRKLFYQHSKERLKENDGLMHHFHNKNYEFAKKFCKEKKVLDVACGSGYGTYLLANVAKEIKGLDLSEEAIDYCKKKYRRDNLQFIQGDATNLPFEDNSFDVIVSFETIEHIPRFLIFLKELDRILKKDGVILLSTPNNKGDHPILEHHIFEFDDEEVKILMEKFFKNVNLHFLGYSEKRRKMVEAAKGWKLHLREFIVKVFPYPLKKKVYLILPHSIRKQLNSIGLYLREEISSSDFEEVTDPNHAVDILVIAQKQTH